MNTIERILKLMQDNDVNAAQLTKEIPLTNGLITQWKQGKQKPSLDALNKISRYFGVTIDYLVNGEEYSKPDMKNVLNTGTFNNNSTFINGNNLNINENKKSKSKKNEISLSEQQKELMRIYNSLSAREQIELMSFAFKLEENNKKNKN